MIHWLPVPVSDRSFCRSGIASATIVWSMNIIATAKIIATSTSLLLPCSPAAGLSAAMGSPSPWGPSAMLTLCASELPQRVACAADEWIAVPEQQHVEVDGLGDPQVGVGEPALDALGVVAQQEVGHEGELPDVIAQQAVGGGERAGGLAREMERGLLRADRGDPVRDDARRELVAESEAADLHGRVVQVPQARLVAVHAAAEALDEPRAVTHVVAVDEHDPLGRR